MVRVRARTGPQPAHVELCGAKQTQAELSVHNPGGQRHHNEIGERMNRDRDPSAAATVVDIFAAC